MYAFIKTVRMRRVMRRRLKSGQGGLDEIMLFESDELTEEVEKSGWSNEEKVSHCADELRSAFYADPVVYGAYGKDIYVAALKQLYPAAA